MTIVLELNNNTSNVSFTVNDFAEAHLQTHIADSDNPHELTWDKLLHKPDLVTQIQLTTAIDNANLFNLYLKESSSKSAIFRVLNGISIDINDEIKVSVFSGNTKISSKKITGTSVQGDKEITVSGLSELTNYTARAALLKKVGSEVKTVDSNQISFTTTTGLFSFKPTESGSHEIIVIGGGGSYRDSDGQAAQLKPGTTQAVALHKTLLSLKSK